MNGWCASLHDNFRIHWHLKPPSPPSQTLPPRPSPVTDPSPQTRPDQRLMRRRNRMAMAFAGDASSSANSSARRFVAAV
eukprot:1185195-Prorocentrum_minimum.AAC.2